MFRNYLKSAYRNLLKSKVSSFINNQTSGTRSRFYNWDGVSAWVYLFTSTAYNARNPSPYEDIIDSFVAFTDGPENILFVSMP